MATQPGQRNPIQEEKKSAMKSMEENSNTYLDLPVTAAVVVPDSQNPCNCMSLCKICAFLDEPKLHAVLYIGKY